MTNLAVGASRLGAVVAVAAAGCVSSAAPANWDVVIPACDFAASIRDVIGLMRNVGIKVGIAEGFDPRWNLVHNRKPLGNQYVCHVPKRPGSSVVGRSANDLVEVCGITLDECLHFILKIYGIQEKDSWPPPLLDKILCTGTRIKLPGFMDRVPLVTIERLPEPIVLIGGVDTSSRSPDTRVLEVRVDYHS